VSARACTAVSKVDLPLKSHSATDNHMIRRFSLFLHNPFTTEADGIKVSCVGKQHQCYRAA